MFVETNVVGLQNNLALVLSFMFPLFLILSFAFIVPPVLKRIVYEKETGVKVRPFTWTTYPFHP